MIVESINLTVDQNTYRIPVIRVHTFNICCIELTIFYYFPIDKSNTLNKRVNIRPGCQRVPVYIAGTRIFSLVLSYLMSCCLLVSWLLLVS